MLKINNQSLLLLSRIALSHLKIEFFSSMEKNKTFFASIKKRIFISSFLLLLLLCHPNMEVYLQNEDKNERREREKLG